jgi:hypothetical protein
VTTRRQSSGRGTVAALRSLRRSQVRTRSHSRPLATVVTCRVQRSGMAARVSASRSATHTMSPHDGQRRSRHRGAPHLGTVRGAHVQHLGVRTRRDVAAFLMNLLRERRDKALVSGLFSLARRTPGARRRSSVHGAASSGSCGGLLALLSEPGLHGLTDERRPATWLSGLVDGVQHLGGKLECCDGQGAACYSGGHVPEGITTYV